MNQKGGQKEPNVYNNTVASPYITTIYKNINIIEYTWKWVRSTHKMMTTQNGWGKSDIINKSTIF